MVRLARNGAPSTAQRITSHHIRLDLHRRITTPQTRCSCDYINVGATTKLLRPPFRSQSMQTPARPEVKWASEICFSRPHPRHKHTRLANTCTQHHHYMHLRGFTHHWRRLLTAPVRPGRRQAGGAMAAADCRERSMRLPHALCAPASACVGPALACMRYGTLLRTRIHTTRANTTHAHISEAPAPISQNLKRFYATRTRPSESSLLSDSSFAEPCEGLCARGTFDHTLRARTSTCLRLACLVHGQRAHRGCGFRHRAP